MSSEVTLAVLSGALGVVGTVVGAVLNDVLGRSSEKRPLIADGERRWLQERRASYAAYLRLSIDLLRELDALGVMLSYDGSESISEEEEEIIQEGLPEYFHRWETELQSALADVQLIATPLVADIADRVSALLEPTAVIELRGRFIDYYPIWF